MRKQRKMSDIGPFGIVPLWLLRTDASPGSIRLFAELAVMTNDEDACWPALETMASRCGVSRRTISTYISELERVGAISHDRRGPHSSVYVVQFAAPLSEKSGSDLPEKVETDFQSRVEADFLQNHKQLEPEPKNQKKLPRKRDVLADALARAEGADPLEVPASRMRTLCVKANELRKLNPDITAEEVLRRASNWSSHFDHASISGPAIVAHWGRLAHKGASGNGDLRASAERILQERKTHAGS